MNTTEYFKRTIQAYLEERAMEDELFAAKYDNPDKNIDDCVTYILNWVQKSGCNGFCDDEIYGQAIHYYEEKDIEVGKPQLPEYRKRKSRWQQRYNRLLPSGI